MTTWVLFIIFMTSFDPNGVTLQAVEYQTQEECFEQRDQLNNNKQLEASTQSKIGAICLELPGNI